MPSTRDIRRRIKSVKNTAQITKAMQMVASAKMRRAQEAAVASRPLAVQLYRMMRAAIVGLGEDTHPLMDRRESGAELILLVTTDKGLCGPLNTNLVKMVVADAPKDAKFVTVGRKGRLQLGRLRREVLADFVVPDTIKYGDVRPIAKFLIEQFESGAFGKVSVYFTNFINTITQKPMAAQLLPFEPAMHTAHDGLHGHNEAPAEAEPAPQLPYKFEPDAKSVLSTLLPQALTYYVFHSVLEAKASEHSARMVAMKNATDNAKQLVKDLTLEYNKVRQAAITTEILEIATAAAAMDN